MKPHRANFALLTCALWATISLAHAYYYEDSVESEDGFDNEPDHSVYTRAAVKSPPQLSSRKGYAPPSPSRAKMSQQYEPQRYEQQSSYGPNIQHEVVCIEDVP